MTDRLAPTALLACGPELRAGRLLVVEAAYEEHTVIRSLTGSICPKHDVGWETLPGPFGDCLVSYVRSTPGVTPGTLQQRAARAAQKEFEDSLTRDGQVAFPAYLGDRIAAAVLAELGLRRDYGA